MLEPQETGFIPSGFCSEGKRVLLILREKLQQEYPQAAAQGQPGGKRAAGADCGASRVATGQQDRAPSRQEGNK